MNILVSGSKGLIGRQLIKQLKIVYPDAKIYELNRTIDLSNEQLISLDLLTADKSKCEKIFEKVKPKLFFHLAWNTDHKDYLTSLNNKLWEEVTINLIDAFYESGGYKFIGIGSSVEYDWEKNELPFDEINSIVNGNKWAYGKAKNNVYNHLKSLNNKYFQWARIFFVFGPGQTNNRLIPLIINTALINSDPLLINLALKRDYISTFEIARQIGLMSTTSYTGPYNVCSGESLVLKDLVTFVENGLKKKVPISKVKFQDNFDIEEIVGKLDVIKRYFPNYNYSRNNFLEDLKKTITYYEKFNKHYE